MNVRPTVVNKRVGTVCVPYKFNIGVVYLGSAPLLGSQTRTGVSSALQAAALYESWGVMQNLTALSRPHPAR